MRVGVRIPCERPSGRLVELARMADRVGVDELWVVEDCFYAGAIATAATALAVTERVTVGIGVLPAVARNAAIVAMELAALAEMHPGRLIAGFGHGVASWMRQIGAFPPSQLAALEETLLAVRALLAGERVSTSGRQVRLDDVVLEFPPSVVPKVVAGVRGPKSLALSGRSADGTILAEPAAPEYVVAAREKIAAAAHEVITYNWLALDDDPARARERARASVASSVSPGGVEHLRPLPFGAEVVELVESGADVAEGLRPEWVEHLSVSGTLEQCVAKVEALGAAGADSVVLLPLLDEPEETTIAAAGLIAERVRGNR
ncbi:LLM class flavin-dependent oxidoreductase [Actinokineospora sp. NBRC 105648]|uniref:LLM class flavin-dependent oxidoreductase n=1 Tax=Actinokineospora sp. NBRC 105648 TaxID=3032206 RepID=UPI0024A2F4CE|nr:LLM class flavin-dependent oxidoreductase [Actinokineospora sp. NBRC 105648]GLZ43354.1 N5,N10-methylene tetrahydromethanopterin reductase [Actinokineospora sp. NBRC 105648]